MHLKLFALHNFSVDEYISNGKHLGRIQDLTRGGSDKRPPTLYSCYCYLTSPFFTRKSFVKILAKTSENTKTPLDPTQRTVTLSILIWTRYIRSKSIQDRNSFLPSCFDKPRVASILRCCSRPTDCQIHLISRKWMGHFVKKSASLYRSRDQRTHKK